ncbi:uncharacterized protein LOC129317088 isoform X2 [Prosopis cineraria]|uniref:uncharacterized protein LOC129317088 isoform X2 n=1 Tax=Prosopis cineraria TaxID=364024 RepID=UPI00240F7404|nr:uncharacterized protein LOC129317088 isoform X2 [Prosopis cineraria]
MEAKGYQLRNDLHIYGVESIFHYQTGVEEQMPTFQYLEHLNLTKCSRLKFIFSTHICQSLPKLTYLSISDCEELEAIFSRNEGIEKNLSITKACLLKLEDLEISNCNKLKFVLSFMINDANPILPQLRTLTILDSSQLEEIFKCSNIEDNDIDLERQIKFPNLKYVRLKKLPRLVDVCHLFKLHVVEFCRLKVDECPKLMPTRSATIGWREKRLEREYVLKCSQLNNNEALTLPFSLLNAGELAIQGSVIVDTFQIMGNDDQEEIEDSKFLRSEQQMLEGLVPTQVLCFQYLHSLKMELEVIFGHGSQDDVNYDEKIVLSSLRKIELENLPNFIRVCQGMQIQVQMSDISIRNCPKFLDSSLGYAIQQLETASLQFPQASTENSNFHATTSVEKQLYVNEEKEMILISRVEVLSLKDSRNFMCVWEGPSFLSFQNLWHLKVNGCSKLKCIFPSTVIKSLPCLWYLHIEECEELEEIMSSEPHFPNASSSSFCFPKLHSLQVLKCRKLKWLFPSLPSTQHLPLLEKLRKLRIEHCYQLEGLFKCEVEIQEKGFYNLLPKLQFINVEDCPMFSQTALATLQSFIHRGSSFSW